MRRLKYIQFMVKIYDIYFIMKIVSNVSFNDF